MAIYSPSSIFGGFPLMGVPPNEWFIMEDSTKMDDLRVPLFQEPPYDYIYIYTHINLCMYIDPYVYMYICIYRSIYLIIYE